MNTCFRCGCKIELYELYTIIYIAFKKDKLEGNEINTESIDDKKLFMCESCTEKMGRKILGFPIVRIFVRNLGLDKFIIKNTQDLKRIGGIKDCRKTLKEAFEIYKEVHWSE